MIFGLRQGDVTLAPALLSVTLDPGAATGGTLTVPAAAIAGVTQYLTRIRIARSSTAALAGTATLQITTTNLPGNPFYRVGNAVIAGGTLIDVDEAFDNPLKVTAANTNTTFVFPAPGAAVLWTATVWYYLGF